MAQQTQAKTFNLKSEAYDWFEAIVFAATTVIILFTFFFRVVGVEGQSMQNTLNKDFQPGVHEVQDRIIISNLFYTPERGDIVVCALPGQAPIIKRVIGLEGDKVEITDDGRVFVNEHEIEEPYIKEEPYHNSYDHCAFPIEVPEGCVFVLGDNRNNSKDSRYAEIGCVPTEYILGHALFRIFPFSDIGSLTDR